MVKMSECNEGLIRPREEKQFIEELDVVKKGYLHIKRPPTNIKLRLKTWQKRYIVLRDNTVDRGSRLEISSSKDIWEDKSKKCDQYVLDMRNSCSVCEYKKSKSFPYSFTLTRKGHSSLILGAETEHELKQWMCAINLLNSKGPIRYHHNSTNSIFRDSTNVNVTQKSDGSWTQDPRRSLQLCGGSLDLPSLDCPFTLDKWIIQNKGSRKSSAPNNIEFSPKDGCLQLPRGFAVTVYQTPSGGKESIGGNGGGVFLEVTSSYVILHQVDGDVSELVRWPLVHIRKFKCEDRPRPAHDLLTLEASCHCECGGGAYQFTTNHGRELVLLVRDAMRKLSLKRREQEEKLQEMRSMRKLRLSMRTESYPCLQNKLHLSRQASTEERSRNKNSNGNIPNGEIPYYLTLLPDDYCSSTPDDSSSESDTESIRTSQSYSGSSSPDQRIRSRTASNLTTSSVSSTDDLPPLPPPRPKHTFSTGSKPLPPLPIS